MSRSKLNPITFSGGVKSISDDDLCATCQYCQFKPGEQSSCTLSWPGLEDDDGYVKQCIEFKSNGGVSASTKTVNAEKWELPCVTPIEQLDKRLFDAVEVHPCKEVEGGLEQCDDTDIELAMWSVYLHLIEGGIQCVADFESMEAAHAHASMLETWLDEHLKYPRLF